MPKSFTTSCLTGITNGDIRQVDQNAKVEQRLWWQRLILSDCRQCRAEDRASNCTLSTVSCGRRATSCLIKSPIYAGASTRSLVNTRMTCVRRPTIPTFLSNVDLPLSGLSAVLEVAASKVLRCIFQIASGSEVIVVL